MCCALQTQLIIDHAKHITSLFSPENCLKRLLSFDSQDVPVIAVRSWHIRDSSFSGFFDNWSRLGNFSSRQSLFIYNHEINTEKYLQWNKNLARFICLMVNRWYSPFILAIHPRHPFFHILRIWFPSFNLLKVAHFALQRLKVYHDGFAITMIFCLSSLSPITRPWLAPFNRLFSG